MNRSAEQSSADAQHQQQVQQHHHQSYVKQEAVNYGYDASSYLNYTAGTASNPAALNQPLPGQPPLPPMPPPQAAVPPPPAAMFGPVPTQVQQLHSWPAAAAAWQWIPQAAAAAAQLTQQQSHRDLSFAFQKDMSARNNFVKRERFNNNRHNAYQQRGNYHRKNNRRMQQRYDQASYYGAAMAGQELGMSWQKTNEALMGHMHMQQQNLLAHANASNAAKRESTPDQDKKEEIGGHKKSKQRKPMSVSYPSRPWNQEDAEKALKIENEHNRSVRAQSLIIKFPDPELNKDVVRSFHSGIQNIHFQSPSGARYCFVQMKEGTNIDETIKELEKIQFGCGHLKVERKSLRDEDNPMPQEIDPYTLYIGNLPESLNVNEVKNQFPTAVRVDVGYAQKMRNTRYAFIRYNTVDESIAAYKSAHSLMWDGRSIIVRFRRQRGNNCPGEPKASPKIKSEAAKAAAHDNNSAKNNEDKEKKHITPGEPKCTNDDSIIVTDSIDLVKTSSTSTENSTNQHNQSTFSQEPIVNNKTVESAEDSGFVTEIKEEPVDYEESNEISVEEDDEDDEGELYPDINYIHYDDDSTEDNMSPYKEFPSDKSSDEDIPSDNLDTVFKDLVNTARDIGVHDS